MILEAFWAMCLQFFEISESHLAFLVLLVVFFTFAGVARRAWCCSHLLALFVVLVVALRCCCRCLSCLALFAFAGRACLALRCPALLALLVLFGVVGVSFCISSTRLSSLFSFTRFPFFACPV